MRCLSIVNNLDLQIPINISFTEIENLFNKSWDYLKSESPKVLFGDFLFLENVTVTLIFVDDQYIQELNHQWRNQNKSTDVLSFSYLEGVIFPHDATQEFDIGEIYISCETAKRQADSFDHSLQQEVSKLFVHGLLHLFGFTHNRDDDFLKMNYYENIILNS